MITERTGKLGVQVTCHFFLRRGLSLRLSASHLGCCTPAEQQPGAGQYSGDRVLTAPPTGSACIDGGKKQAAYLASQAGEITIKTDTVSYDIITSLYSVTVRTE